MTSCLNMQIINELIDLMGDDMEMLINSFIQDSEEKLKLLKAMDISSEQDAIFKMAHSLKGTSRNMGIVDFSDYCENIEQLAKQNCLTSKEFKFSALEELYTQAKQQLKQL